MRVNGKIVKGMKICKSYDKNGNFISEDKYCYDKKLI